MPTKVCLVKAVVLPVVMYGCELNCEESWAPKNWCFWTVVLEKTLESPLDCKEIQPVHPRGDQSWVFIRRTDAEAETPVLWPPHAKSWVIGKDPDAGRDWGQEEKGMTEDWDGWMASPTRWAWVWVNSECWWWTGRPGVLRFMGSQRVGHDLATELKWTELSTHTCNHQYQHECHERASYFHQDCPATQGKNENKARSLVFTIQKGDSCGTFCNT